MAIAFIIAFAVVCLGWGRLISWLCYQGHRPGWAFELALGLAVLSALGGLLNSLHAATPIALHLLGLAGLCLSFVLVVWACIEPGLVGSIRCLREQCREAGGPAAWIPDAGALLMTAFFALTILPASAFNVHDDFHTYLVRPTRMLATGTLAGNPFDPVGVDSLGNHSFLQAFFLLWRPAQEINGFDAVFCFGACGCLIAAVARKLRVQPAIGLLCVLVFASINPQFVNISPIYSGALLTAALLFSCWLALQPPQGAGATVQSSFWVPVGLIGAALAGLKLTFAFYAGFYFVIFFALLCLQKNHPACALRAALVTAVSLLPAMLPWFLAPAHTYLKAHRLAAAVAATATLDANYLSVTAHDLGKAFSAGQLFYGGDKSHYLLILAFLVLAGVLGLKRWWRGKFDSDLTITVLLVAGSFSAVAMYLVNAHLFEVQTAIRYTCPTFIGVVPFAALLCGRLFRSEMPSSLLHSKATSRITTYSRAGVLLAQIVLLIVFLPVTMQRFNRTRASGTLLSYPFKQRLLDYNDAVFGQDHKANIRALQNKVPPGETLFVWTAEPFLFDFQRNPILSASEHGFVNPLLHFPAGIPSEMLPEYFRSWGIRYAAFETEGPAITPIKDFDLLLRDSYALHRKLGDYGLYARRALLSLSETHEIVARTGHIMLVDLTPHEGANLTAKNATHNQHE